MKFPELLHRRDELLRQARLANVAYAYQWLGDFAGRIARSGLRGEVTLRGPNPEEDQRRAKLVAEDFSQSVVAEHFLDEEIAELHAVLAFVHDASLIVELKFRLEEIAERYLPPLRQVLEAADALPKAQPSAVDDGERDAA